MSNLRPCPFCGCAAVLTATEDVFVHRQIATVECASCEVSMTSRADSLDGAVMLVTARWNNRHVPGKRCVDCVHYFRFDDEVRGMCYAPVKDPDPAIYVDDDGVCERFEMDPLKDTEETRKRVGKKEEKEKEEDERKMKPKESMGPCPKCESERIMRMTGNPGGHPFGWYGMCLDCRFISVPCSDPEVARENWRNGIAVEFGRKIDG